MIDFLPRYRHIINPKLKHIYLTFDTKGDLVIKSPEISQKRIEELLLKKSAWISKSREKFQAKKGKALDFTQENELYYKGTAYPLRVIQHPKKSVKLTFDGTCFTLAYHDYNETLFQKHIDHFYKEEALRFIPEHVNAWAETMGLYPSSIHFRKTKRQWGSCSVKNALSFNTMMMKLPTNVIQYIIVHELAHIKHKHHQKAFWSLVQRYMPDYKQYVHELKNYTT